MGSVAEFALLLAAYLPALQRGITGAAELLTWGVESVKTMVEEGRDPTEDEWSKLTATREIMMNKLLSDDI